MLSSSMLSLQKRKRTRTGEFNAVGPNFEVSHPINSVLVGYAFDYYSLVMATDTTRSALHKFVEVRMSLYVYFI